MDQSTENDEKKLLQGIAQVGRQPILDRHKKTYGYELLYREANAGFNPNQDGNQATARTMLNSFLEFGLNQLVGRHRAFINLTKTFFTDMQPPLVDKSRLVLEVLEDIEIDVAVINGVRRLHEDGYLIALDDYRFEHHWEPLLDYATIIKVDIFDLDLGNYAEEISALKQRGLLLLAEKVETQAEFEQALALGFDLFQGYFFAKPQIMSNRRLESNQILLIKMLARINDPDCTIDDLAALISQDPKFSFKILRFINSAAISLFHKVDSIQQAVVYIGLDRMRAMASLLVMAGIKGSPPEVITTGLVRAEFCQEISMALKSDDSVSAYTVGLLSVMDALAGKPMDTLMETMPFSTSMVDALVTHTGPYSRELNCALALEQYQWQDESVTNLLPLDVLTPIYIKALSRAHEIQQALI